MICPPPRCCWAECGPTVPAPGVSGGAGEGAGLSLLFCVLCLCCVIWAAAEWLRPWAERPAGGRDE